IFSEEAISWEVSDFIPSETLYEMGKRYPSPLFDTTDGQRWCVLVTLHENDIGVFLEIANADIVTDQGTHGVMFSLVLTSGISKAWSEDKGRKFTCQSPSWGWRPFVCRNQWSSFLQSFLDVKIQVRYNAATDSTREFYTSMVNNENDSDCSFLVEGKRIYALSPILCHRSPYFKAMLGSKFTKGQFSKDRPIALPTLTRVVSCLHWMYTSRPWPWCETSFRKMRAIYVAADMFGLEHLAKRALDVICTNINLTNFGDIYVFARTFHQPQLASKSLTFWKQNWAEAQRKGKTAHNQAMVIVEHLKSSGEDEEIWAFAENVLGDRSGGSK
ncbi:hypothetical protein HK102_001199, partial [Quaeritorhiza haematococci]